MKTLYERLKPEHKDVLNSEANKYPHSIVSLVKSMDNTNTYLDLTYAEIGMLVTYSGLKDYGPASIDGLFEANELLNVNSK